jgi:hypothetical protein
MAAFKEKQFYTIKTIGDDQKSRKETIEDGQNSGGQTVEDDQK